MIVASCIRCTTIGSPRTLVAYTIPMVSRLIHPTLYTTTLPKQQQTKMSLSMFATGTSTLNHGSSSSGGGSFGTEPFTDQRRPFWATRPTKEDNTTTPPAAATPATATTATTMLNSIGHNVNAAGAAAGISMADIATAVAKATKITKKTTATKKTKATTTKKKTATTPVESATTTAVEVAATVDDAEDDAAFPDLETDTVTPKYMHRMVAKTHGLTFTQSKKIVDDIVDMIIDVRTQKNLKNCCCILDFFFFSVILNILVVIIFFRRVSSKRSRCVFQDWEYLPRPYPNHDRW
jgi:hypothetical protein